MSIIKKIGLIVLMMLLLAACGSNTEKQSSTLEDPQGEQTNEGNGQLFRENLANSELPPATQLAVGTILLENTDLAIVPDQAEILIPLWKLYINLLESDATAQEELEAMISEIQNVMIPDQLTYITELDLVQEDLMALMNDLGINEGLRPDGEGGTGFTRPEGIQPGGGEGRGQRILEGMDPELLATMEARREEMGGGGFMGASRMQIPVIEALIEMLEGKLENL